MDRAKQAKQIVELKLKAKRLLHGLSPSNPPTVFDKYLKVDFEVPYKYDMIDALGLNESEPKSILDISTCGGWMSWILKELGHELTYTDSFDISAGLIFTMREMLGLHECINFCYDEIEYSKNPKRFYFKPLSFEETEIYFDVIMANSVQPHGYFHVENWRAFIDDCFTNLNEGGYIYISPNHSVGFDALEFIIDEYKSEKILEGWKICK